MINLLSYNIVYGNRFIGERSDEIEIHYNVDFQEETEVKIELSDYIFNTEKQHQVLRLKNGNIWSRFSSRGSHSVNNKKQITTSFVEPLKVSFFNNKTNEIINQFKIDIKFVDVSLRSRDDNKINAWIFGDSHIGHICEDIEYNELEYKDIRINPICKVGLSCNRFSNSDFINFLSYFPIKKRDIILLNFGEIDCRMSIHKKNYDKGIKKDIILKVVLQNYINTIELIKNYYSENRIIVLLPNPPFKDDHIITEEVRKNLLFNSNEIDRIMLHQNFSSTLFEMSILKNNFEIIDLSEFFQNKDGFMNNKILRTEDCHMKSNKEYFDFLYKKLNSYKNEKL